MIDLRSDTVTRPSEEMRQAMARAEVGDDVYGEDPTINELEEEVAGLLGKEAAVFVPSGTMGNQLSIMAAIAAGNAMSTEVWAHEASHVAGHEQGGVAILGRGFLRTFGGPSGLPDAVALRRTLAGADNIHRATPRLLCLENTVGDLGGRVLPDGAELAAVIDVARAAGMDIHLDGARLWNAAVASGRTPDELVGFAGTVSTCFSKGLGAPVGSAVSGSAEVIAAVRRGRKLLGGGMRQAGILAAGALYALRHNRERLAEDHDRAKRLAAGINDIPGLAADEPATNMVLARVAPGTAETVVAQWQAAGLATGPLDADTVRLVVHLEISDADIDAALTAIRRTTR
jgi:threonine aldolase